MTLSNNNKLIQSKHVPEIITITFNFSGELTFLDTLSSPRCSVIVLSGIDATPNAILYGSPVIVGNIVTQQIQQGIGGVVYSVICTVDGTGGLIYTVPERLAILTDDGIFGPGNGLALTGNYSTGCIYEDVFYTYNITPGYRPYGPVSISSGALPVGWTIYISGDQVIITGITNTTGTYTFTIRLYDFVGNVVYLDQIIVVSYCGTATNLYTAQDYNVSYTSYDTFTDTLSTNTISVGATMSWLNVLRDNTKLYILGNLGTARIIDTATNTLLGLMDTGLASTICMVFNAAETEAWAFGANNCSHINLVTETYIATYTTGAHAFTNCLYSSDETLVYCCSAAGTNVGFITVATGVLTIMRSDGGSRGIILDPTSPSLYIWITVYNSGSPGFLRKISTVSPYNIIVDISDIGDRHDYVIAHPAGDIVYITNTSAGVFAGVNVVNIQTNTYLYTIPVGLFPQQMAINVDNVRLYVNNRDSTYVSVIDMNYNQVIKNMDKVHSGSAYIVVSGR